MNFAKIKKDIGTLVNFRKVKFDRERNSLGSITLQQWENASKSIFRQKGDSRSSCVSLFENIDQLLSKESRVPKSVKNSLSVLKRKANLTAGLIENAVARGEKATGTMEKFCKLNQKEIDILTQYLEKQSMKSGLYQKQLLNIKSIRFLELYDNKIFAMPEYLLDMSKPFYHGSKSPLKIAKAGFQTNPRLLQAFFTRELGDAVYLTPEKKVAAHFAPLAGGIVKTDVSSIKNSEVAFVNQRSVGKLTFGLLENKIPVNDQTIKELFTRNGYKAAFTNKAINGEISHIDDIIGTNQSQLAVFDPKNVSVVNPLDVTLQELLDNQKLKVKTKINEVKNFFGVIKNMYNDRKK